MCKPFSFARVGSTILIVKPTNSWFYSTPKVVFSERTAIITNIETYGDELIISFRNTKFNHTVRVHKNAVKGYVCINQKEWFNKRTSYFSWSGHSEEFIKKTLNEKNSSTRQYVQKESYNYNYTFTLL